jgi:hypothetical protein
MMTKQRLALIRRATSPKLAKETPLATFFFVEDDTSLELMVEDVRFLLDRYELMAARLERLENAAQEVRRIVDQEMS